MTARPVAEGGRGGRLRVIRPPAPRHVLPFYIGGAHICSVCCPACSPFEAYDLAEPTVRVFVHGVTLPDGDAA